MDKPCTEQEARGYLKFSMHRVLAELQRPGNVRRSPTLHQAAALLILAYNVGVGAHDGIKGDLADSTLLDLFNRGDISGAAQQFLAWNKTHVDGRLVALDGLTARRRSEQKLFLTQE